MVSVPVKNYIFNLPSGNPMYMVGLGTFQIRGRNLIRSVIDNALALGYRSFDSAFVYRNESEIGESLRELMPKYNLTRKDIYITTKLPPGFSPQYVQEAVKESLTKLNLEYIDLYLVHWPGGDSTSRNSDPKKFRADIWSELVALRNSGLLRDIGVANFTVNHLKELLKHPSGIKPAVNQIEYHPYCQNEEMKDFCRNHGILLQAYSSLGGTGNRDLLNDRVVQFVAKELNRQPAQVLLRWALQQNIAIIPKAQSREHLQANIDLDFEISSESMQLLNKLKSKETKFAWDPKNVN